MVEERGRGAQARRLGIDVRRVNPGQRQRSRRRQLEHRLGERVAHRDDGREWTELRRHLERCGTPRRERADRRVGKVGDVAGNSLDEHDRERVQVGAPIKWGRRRLFGRRVARGPDHAARRGLGPARLREDLRQAEVGDVREAVLVEEKVRRLDIAVNQAARVRVLQRARDLTAERNGLRRS